MKKMNVTGRPQLLKIRNYRYLVEIIYIGGQFAIVSSAAGKAGVPFSGSYTGSKHAINVSKKYEYNSPTNLI